LRADGVSGGLRHRHHSRGRPESTATRALHYRLSSSGGDVRLRTTKKKKKRKEKRSYHGNSAALNLSSIQKDSGLEK